MSGSRERIEPPDLHGIVRLGEPLPEIRIDIPQRTVRVQQVLANLMIVLAVVIGGVTVAWNVYKLPLLWLMWALGAVLAVSLAGVFFSGRVLGAVPIVVDRALLPVAVRVRHAIGMVLLITVPYWASTGWGASRYQLVSDLVVLCAIGVWVLLIPRHTKRAGPISCVRCAYDMTGAVLPCGCPECGAMVAGPAMLTWRVPYRPVWGPWLGGGLVALGALGFVLLAVV